MTLEKRRYNMTLKALFLTLMVGIFFGIGLAIPKFVKNKKKLLSYTSGITFIIMLYLIFVDLFPEVIEVLEITENKKNVFLIVFFIFLGFFLLKILDHFVPEHHHDHKEIRDNEAEHNNHYFHIGFITAMSLIIHNILEGISIYITGINDLKMGILMAISVGCHNLPLGIEIAASMEANVKKKGTKYATFSLLIFSSFLGALFLFLINQELNHVIEGILLSLTLGMLIYISGLELVPEVIKNRKEKVHIMGLLTGMILAIILFIL